jgi:hypothetical protein
VYGFTLNWAITPNAAGPGTINARNGLLTKQNPMTAIYPPPPTLPPLGKSENVSDANHFRTTAGGAFILPSRGRYPTHPPVCHPARAADRYSAIGHIPPRLHRFCSGSAKERLVGERMGCARICNLTIG